MKKYKREFETKEPEQIETFFPISKKKVYKKKDVKGWRGSYRQMLKPKEKSNEKI